MKLTLTLVSFFVLGIFEMASLKDIWLKRVFGEVPQTQWGNQTEQLLAYLDASPISSFRERENGSYRFGGSHSDFGRLFDAHVYSSVQKTSFVYPSRRGNVNSSDIQKPDEHFLAVCSRIYIGYGICQMQDFRGSREDLFYAPWAPGVTWAPGTVADIRDKDTDLSKHIERGGNQRLLDLVNETSRLLKPLYRKNIQRGRELYNSLTSDLETLYINSIEI